MNRIWQLLSIGEARASNDASQTERLYDRYSLDLPQYLQASIKGKVFEVVNIGFGGLALTNHADHPLKLTPGDRFEGTLTFFDAKVPFSARYITERPGKNGPQLAAQFLYDRVDLMDFLRSLILYLKLGATLGGQKAQSFEGEIEFDLKGIDEVGFTAELMVQHLRPGISASCVFAYGQAQLAFSYNRASGFSTFKNFGIGAEKGFFNIARPGDPSVLQKASLILAGFLTAQPDIDVQEVLRLVIEASHIQLQQVL